jgi:hypothetical protein
MIKYNELAALCVFCLLVGGVIYFIGAANDHYNKVAFKNVPNINATIFRDKVTIMDREMLTDSWGYAHWSFIDIQNRGYYTDIGHQDYLKGFESPVIGHVYSITYYCNSDDERHIISMKDAGDDRYKCNGTSGAC